MTEHPLLYTGEMIRAYLADRKTRTSRVITTRNSVCGTAKIEELDLKTGWFHEGDHGICLRIKGLYADEPNVHEVYPRVQPGDVLWIRETHRIEQIPNGWRVVYRADGVVIDREFDYREWHEIADSLRNYKGGWRPSIYMPRWACRAVQTVLTVGGQFVQEIGDTECIAEGIPLGDVTPRYVASQDRRDAFRSLWDSINGKRPDCSWADNPPVWTYGYARHSEERGRP